jgi:mono/diheme cytochrome c family protein
LLAVSALFLTACGDDIIVQADFAGEALAVIPFDNQKASEGLSLYRTYCVQCHGPQGLSTIMNATMILERVYGSQEAVDTDKLAFRSYETMPPEDKIACDFVCQDKIQHFFYRMWTNEDPAQSSSSVTSSSDGANSSSDGTSSSSDSGLTQEQIDARIAAGKTLYEEFSCDVCHEEDGSGNALGGPIFGFVCVVCAEGSYQDMADIIDGTMPVLNMIACNPVTSPQCGSTIADYVWAEFNGFTLTTEGGTRP